MVRDEIKNDDLAYNEKSDFTNTNYCSLAELFAFETDFEEIIKVYLDRTLFTKLFKYLPNNQFVINSTERIQIIKDTIIITGRVINSKKESKIKSHLF